MNQKLINLIDKFWSLDKLETFQSSRHPGSIFYKKDSSFIFEYNNFIFYFNDDEIEFVSKILSMPQHHVRIIVSRWVKKVFELENICFRTMSNNYFKSIK